jgi:D-galactarolactone cycloisomerase
MYRRSLDYARSGVLTASLSAIDVALWDLKGKLLGQPVHVLLGGRRRDTVRVYATGMYFTEGGDLAAKLAREAEGYATQGFRAMKMKVGHSLAQDVKNVRAVRAAIGPDIALMIDANHACNRSEARALCRAVEPLGIGWFEEPLSPEDYAGYAELRQQTDIPIAAGECEYLVHGFKRLLEGQCVDIAQPDTCAAGGLTEVQRIVALVRACNVDLTPHCWGTGIGFAVGLHLTSTLDVTPGRLLGTEPLLEMDRTENPLRDRLTGPRFEVKDGAVAVPDAPGLGIDVDPGLLEQFALR